MIIADPTNPQVFNRYTYTVNNPLRYTDPSGHCHFNERMEIDKWDCSVEEFDAMTIFERKLWLVIFMRQTGCDCFHNIMGVLDFFEQEDLGKTGTWTGLVDAAVLQGFSLGYGNFLASKGESPVMTNVNTGADEWTVFFKAFDEDPNDKNRLTQLWGAAEQAVIDYGVWYAEVVRGQTPTLREKGLIAATDLYRAAVQVPGASNLPLLDPFDPELREQVRQLATFYWYGICIAEPIVCSGL